MSLALGAGEVHVWRTAVGGALPRVLCRYLDCPPEEVELLRAPGGKPRLAGTDPALRFSLSHSGDLALVAVSAGLEVGVDVERIAPRRDFARLAGRWLGDEAAARVRESAAGERAGAFYAAWVRHEAVAKCLGTGLGRLPAGAPPVSIRELDAGGGYAAALAVAAERDAMLPRVPNAPAWKGRAAGGRRGTRALVIGSGFIGSHVVAALAAENRPPVVLTRSPPRTSAVADAVAPGGLHVADAADADALAAALDGVDEVFYCAGGLLPAASEEDPKRDEELTLQPLRAVLEALRERPAIRLAYVSSGGTVYGQPEELPVPETAPTRPVGSYGRLHLACEEEIERHRAAHGLDARILRCATVYGENQLPDRGQGAVVTFLHRIEHGKKIDLYGGGETIRDYVHAGDVAAVAIETMARDDCPGVLNVASGIGTSVLDLVAMAEREIGREAIVERHPERGFDVHEIVLDIARLRNLTGFEPTPLRDGIARTRRWLSALAAERV